MKQYKDLIITAAQSIILVLLLVIACLLNNELVKGILLFLFAGVLIGNTIYRLKIGKTGKLRSKVFYSVILFFESLLTIGAISVIVMAVI